MHDTDEYLLVGGPLDGEFVDSDPQETARYLKVPYRFEAGPMKCATYESRGSYFVHVMRPREQ